MSQIMLIPLDRPGVAARVVSPRVRSELVYFAVLPDTPLGENEYVFDPTEVEKWLDDGIISLVSPLDTANMTDVELSEDQEAFLSWLAKEKVCHIRVEER